MQSVHSQTPLREEAYRLRMSYEQFLQWADEDVHAEWVDGEVIVFMPPKDRHQDIVTFLVTLLRNFADSFGIGVVRVAPFEMRLSPSGPSREPDILFISAENLHRLTEERVEGPADLVIEVVSQDSVRRDRQQKFAEYQSFGVREYWLVDSQTPEGKAEAFTLNEQGVYEPIPVQEGVIHSRVIPGFWLRVEWLGTDTMPDAFTAFAQMVGLPMEVLEALRSRRSTQEG
ncbi:MAG: Uma2 family endonuclease [Chthonomonadetes bacterium]|nr:Uma2 family endonuclease [Chthonomonadetes bacterium]